MEESIKGVVDMHVHTSPDLRNRRYDDLELCDAAVAAGARAIVIKSHLSDTSCRAALVNSYNRKVHGKNGFTMFGGITLNACVGGLNPAAVETALKLGAKVVWLPTASARNHLLKTGRPTGGCVEVTRGGDVVPELLAILELVKAYDAVLATGHIAPEESFCVAKAARQAGITKLVITHPEWWLTKMTPEDQIRIVNEYGAVLERCYAQNLGVGAGNGYKSNLQDNLEVILAVGYRNVLVSTDGGQVENPPWEREYAEYVGYLKEHGIPEEHIRYMSRDLPCGLLGIKP